MFGTRLTSPAQPPFFLVSQSWKDTRQLESLCQSIYFPIEPIPSGSTTLLHGLLYFVIRDYIHEGDPDLARYDLGSSKSFCERTFSAGLDSPQMLADPTLEKVQALLIGVSLLLFIEICLTSPDHQSTRRIRHPALLDIPFDRIQYVPDHGHASKCNLSIRSPPPG